MNPNNGLYGERADLYAAIANDRNFVRELRRMGVFDLGDNSRFVELFAGPAYHGRTLIAECWTGEVCAIDNSPQMAALAKDAGFTGRYVCKDAIEGLDLVELASIVCIPRFSIVLVDSDYVKLLLVAIRRVLQDSGRLFIEVHPSAASDIDWSTLSIQKRRIDHGPLTIVCEWPRSVTDVAGIKDAVDMSVRVSVSDGTEAPIVYDFVSREYLHAKTSILSWAREANFVLDPARSFVTESGEYLAFAPTHRLASCPVAPELIRAAFTARFDLSSEESREKAIEMSGLDVNEHDSPLSRHVYNLL